jgi:hypothetical protein
MLHARFAVILLVSSTVLCSLSTAAFAASNGAAASAPVRSTVNAAPTKSAESTVRPRQVADTNRADKLARQSDHRENFQKHILALSSWKASGENYYGHKVIWGISGDKFERGLVRVPPTARTSLSSAINQQAGLNARELVKELGPAGARAYVAGLAKVAKDFNKGGVHYGYGQANSKEKPEYALMSAKVSRAYAKRLERAVEVVIDQQGKK